MMILAKTCEDQTTTFVSTASYNPECSDGLKLDAASMWFESQPEATGQGGRCLLSPVDVDRALRHQAHPNVQDG